MFCGIRVSDVLLETARIRIGILHKRHQNFVQHISILLRIQSTIDEVQLWFPTSAKSAPNLQSTVAILAAVKYLPREARVHPIAAISIRPIQTETIFVRKDRPAPPQGVGYQPPSHSPNRRFFIAQIATQDSPTVSAARDAWPQANHRMSQSVSPYIFPCAPSAQ